MDGNAVFNSRAFQLRPCFLPLQVKTRRQSARNRRRGCHKFHGGWWEQSNFRIRRGQERQAQQTTTSKKSVAVEDPSKFRTWDLNAHASAHACACVCALTHARTRTRARAPACTHICVDAHVRGCAHAPASAPARACTHTHSHTHTHAHTRTHTHIACAHAHTHTHTCARARVQFNKKQWNLGNYAVEADAAAARDVVAKVLGYPLNFPKPRETSEITCRRSTGADKFVADAVEAARAFVLGPRVAL